MDPNCWIGTINCNQNCSFTLLIVGPNTVDWLSSAIFSIYQATWAWFVSWVIFDDLTIAYGVEYVFKL